MIIKLLQPISLLLSLSLILAFIFNYFERQTFIGKILSGIAYGFLAVMAMMIPFDFIPGFIFDSRSVIISLSGFFGGPITAVPAIVIGAVYRLFLGGGGAVAGALVVVISGLIGVLAFYLRNRFNVNIQAWHFLVFGFVTHFFSIFGLAVLPSDVMWKVIQKLSIPFFGIYPFLTVFLGIIIHQIELHFDSKIELKKSQDRYENLYKKLKNSQEELQYSHTNLNQVVKAGGIGLWEWDLITNKVMYSAEYKRQIGYEEHELTNEYSEWESRLHPEDLAATIADVKQSIENINQNHQAEFRFRHKDGSYRWILAGASFTVNDDGKPIKMMGSHVDITDRKQEEERYKRTIQSSIDGFWVVDTNGRILDVNDTYCRMIGYSRKELLEMSIADVENTESPEQINIHIKKILKTGNGRFESSHRAKNGDVIDIDVSTTYVHGKVGMFYSFIRDITEKKLKERIQTSQLKLIEYASSHNATELLKKFLNEAETLTGSNIGFYHFYDEAQELIALKTWSTNTLETMCKAEGAGTHYPIEKAGVWADCARKRKPVLHNDYPSLSHKKGLPKGHAPIYRELVVPVIRRDKIVAILGVGNKKNDYDDRDIYTVQTLADLAWETVVRKQAEEALQRNEEELQAVVDNSVDAIGVSKQGVHTFVNIAYLRMFGYQNSDELIGKPVFDLIAPNERDRIKQYVSARSQGYEISTNYQTKGLKKDGAEFDMEVNVAQYGQKEDKKTLVILRDVTDRNILEEKLRQSQKMESIGSLAGGIAHDFNNLLFPIIGMSELLLEDLPKGSLEYDNAKEIFQAGKRAGDLVQQILAFSRQSEHKMTSVRAQNVLKDVLKLSRSTIPSNIEIKQNIQQNCGVIMADPTQIHQISMNLITNAFHAVEDKNGIIDIELKELVLKSGDFAESELEPGSYLKLSVSDNGIGMSQNTISKIFEPYFTTKAKGKGTGLGLAVVYGIVKEHKGDIKVYSEIGKGTTFSVFIPLMEKSGEIASTQQRSKLAMGTESILLIDDEVSVVKLQGQMLSRLGYQVRSETSSMEALKRFRANPESFDLIISDMTMPEMTGDRLSKEILSIRPDTPIIICTGFSERINKEQAELLGVKGFLMKPVVKSDMAQMIRNVLDEAIENHKSSDLF